MHFLVRFSVSRRFVGEATLKDLFSVINECHTNGRIALQEFGLNHQHPIPLLYGYGPPKLSLSLAFLPVRLSHEIRELNSSQTIRNPMSLFYYHFGYFHPLLLQVKRCNQVLRNAH